MIVIGVLLVMGLGLVALEGVGYVRGGYNSAFWNLPLDGKLDHVDEHRWEWWWVSIWGTTGLFVMSGGVFGLAYLLGDAGEGALAAVGLGGYTIALISWVFGSTLQAAGVSRASRQRVETGATPAWIHPLWDVGYYAEAVWIIGANIAYAVFGVAILGSDLVGSWAGWVALIGGLAVSAGTVIARDGFPQLGLLVPAILGVALLLAA